MDMFCGRRLLWKLCLKLIDLFIFCKGGASATHVARYHNYLGMVCRIHSDFDVWMEREELKVKFDFHHHVGPCLSTSWCSSKTRLPGGGCMANTCFYLAIYLNHTLQSYVNCGRRKINSWRINNFDHIHTPSFITLSSVDLN